jgi:hypothetical protein
MDPTNQPSIAQPGSANPVSRRCAWGVVLALLAACSGTTGLENILGADASSPGLDASLAEGGGDDSGEALDRSVPSRPPAQDTGVSSMPGMQDAGGSVGDGGGSVEAAPLPGNTLDLLRAISPSCYDYDAGDEGDAPVNQRGCAWTDGCLDPMQQGSTCELLSAGVPGNGEAGTIMHLEGPLPDGKMCGSILGANETTICLQTLATMFSTNCAVNSEGPRLTQCLCGATTVNPCLAGQATPTGALYDIYACDFNSTSGANINSAFTMQNFGAGTANALVQCMAGFISNDPDCCTCLGGYVDGGVLGSAGATCVLP